MLDISDFHELVGFEILAVAFIEKGGGEVVKLDNGDPYELELGGDTLMELDEVVICRRETETTEYKLITGDGVSNATLLRSVPVQ